MNDNTWHSKTYTEWLEFFDAANWREKLASSLRDIAITRGASASDRVTALQIWNEGIQNSALLPDPTYPQIMRDVLLEIAGGIPYVERLSKPERRAIHARLVGVRWMLATSYEIIGATNAAKQLAEAATAGTPALDRLLS